MDPNQYFGWKNGPPCGGDGNGGFEDLRGRKSGDQLAVANNHSLSNMFQSKGQGGISSKQSAVA